ncbi:Crp/Fnr family transcriptional regulator [Qipengyuania seohaensis]|uniref:Crp/Fnr family transcriptional regulator n=1 Tax=Qipengyuania seohaensis TaxID=266951 RepID=UPI0018E23C22|nr:Crp/Fnr family transcriptional regulator [Qipengyuania seohaensis]
MALDFLSARSRSYQAKRHVVRHGDPLSPFPIITDGWAARCQILRDGSRQIFGLLLPGDMCHFNANPHAQSTHDIVALSSLQVAFIEQRDWREIKLNAPDIAVAIRRYANFESSILSAWIVSIGRRNALERTAHLICEVRFRLELINQVDGDSFAFPLTQDDLADVLGLTPVHTNRKLQDLRQAGLITLHGKRLTVHDLSRLERLAGFDREYLLPGVRELVS